MGSADGPPEPEPVVVHKYSKFVESDVSMEDAIELLQTARTRNRLLRMFDPSDIKNLATVLSVLAFKDAEPIAKKGERASFLSLVLQGQVKVGTDLTATRGVAPFVEPLPTYFEAGTFFGEMGYFENIEHDADIDAHENCVVAILPFTVATKQ